MTVPEDLESVAVDPEEDELMVITLPADPVQVKIPPMVWVAELGKVTVLGAVAVKLLKVLLPVTITAPVPELVITKFP